MHCPELISIELATIGGDSWALRRVSPKTQAIRPSLSRTLAPMSAACQPGRSVAATRWLTAAASLIPRRPVGAGQRGCSDADPDAGVAADLGRSPEPADVPVQALSASSADPSSTGPSSTGPRSTALFTRELWP